jgi:NADPH-dependent 2,4-dienoyl-CoA reductase/sulfur reductase-like enzyme
VSRRYDLAVVGAGPAGLAAAALAPGYGMSTVVFDEQRAPGGQIHRGVLSSPLAQKEMLGDDYAQGAALIERFRRAGATHVPSATVIGVTKSDDGTCELTVAVGGRAPPHRNGGRRRGHPPPPRARCRSDQAGRCRG